MAEIEEALVTRLTGHSGLSALVGTRVYPIVRPQDGTLPCVTYERTESRYVESLGGNTDLAYPLIRVTSWATTYAGAKAVDRQVWEALDRYANASASPAILDCLHQGSEEDYDDDTETWWCSRDFEVWYRES